MNQLKVKATFREEVYVDPAEAWAEIKAQLGFANSRDSFLCVHDGELLRGEDVSHHGSPLYEYTLVSNNPNWVALYDSVKRIDGYFRHSNDPEWQKVIDIEADEEESPIMRM